MPVALAPCASAPALEAIRLIAREAPEAIAGVGTLVRPADFAGAKAAGGIGMLTAKAKGCASFAERKFPNSVITALIGDLLIMPPARLVSAASLPAIAKIKVAGLTKTAALQRSPHGGLPRRSPSLSSLKTGAHRGEV